MIEEDIFADAPSSGFSYASRPRFAYAPRSGFAYASRPRFAYAPSSGFAYAPRSRPASSTLYALSPAIFLVGNFSVTSSSESYSESTIMSLILTSLL